VSTRDRKGKLVATIATLIENVAGADTPWSAIAAELRSMRTEELDGLAYRIRRALEISYNEGRQSAVEADS
jgi:hypothetical protein